MTPLSDQIAEQKRLTDEALDLQWRHCRQSDKNGFGMKILLVWLCALAFSLSVWVALFLIGYFACR